MYTQNNNTSMNNMNQMNMQVPMHPGAPQNVGMQMPVAVESTFEEKHRPYLKYNKLGIHTQISINACGAGKPLVCDILVSKRWCIMFGQYIPLGKLWKCTMKAPAAAALAGGGGGLPSAAQSCTRCACVTCALATTEISRRLKDKKMKKKETISISQIKGSGLSVNGSGLPEGYGVFQSRDQILGSAQVDRKLDAEGGKQPDTRADDAHVRHPTSYFETMLHIFKGNIGSGLLAMGDAFKNGGIIFAPIMTAVLGVISVHAQHILLNCSEAMHRQSKRERPPDFAETVGLVFATGPLRLRPLARAMTLLVDLFLCVTQLGFCCVYIVFIANNVKIICDQYDVKLDLSVHMILVVIPILLSCMVRNLKYLTPFSTVANILMAVGVGVVIYEASRDLPDIKGRVYMASWHQLPLYFGTAIYAFEGIGLVLPLRNEMRHPEQFQKPLGVLNVSMVIVASIFVVVGSLGYLKWGEDVAGSLTLNLEPGKVLSNVVQAVIGLAMLFTYPLQFYVPVEITWPALRRRLGAVHPVALELGYRSLLVLLTFILAESIPQLGLFISLVGAVSSTALALIFPPIIELVHQSQQQGGIPWYNIVKDTLIITLGMFIFVTGTYQSIAEIVHAFQK